MRKNRLDMVETFDQFGHDHWKALGTKLGGVDVVKNILRDLVKVTVETIHRLTALTSFDVAAGEYKVQEFFLTRDGLLIISNFRSFILANANHGVPYVSGATLCYADIAKSANDDEIRAELPEGHVFTNVNTFLVFLAALIEAQWLNQTEGVLLNTNYCSNIFYVKIAGTIFRVDVLWDSDDGRWECNALRLSATRRNVGDRVFSATGALAA